MKLIKLPCIYLIFDGDTERWEASNTNNIVNVQWKLKVKGTQWERQITRRLNVWNQGFDAFETESGEIAAPPVACWRMFSPCIVAQFGSL